MSKHAQMVNILILRKMNALIVFILATNALSRNILHAHNVLNKEG